MARKTSDFAREYGDREAIRDCLQRYARSMDRLDRELMTEVFWPEATDDHNGTFVGTAADYIDFTIPVIRAMNHTMHFIGNSLIDIRGSRAKVETYGIAYHNVDIEGTTRCFIVGGRQLDDFEKREDEWRIYKRILLLDWFKNIPDAPEWSNGFQGHRVDGTRAPGDLSYSFFNWQTDPHDRAELQTSAQ